MTAPTRTRAGRTPVEAQFGAVARAAARAVARRDADAAAEHREQHAAAADGRTPVEPQRWWPYGDEPPFVADPPVDAVFPCGCGTSDAGAGAGG